MWSRAKKRGFMLLELIIGIFILIVAVAGIHSLVSRFFVYNRYLCSKMTAAYLTQEGIEIVKNIRDTNWIEGGGWTEGIFCCEPASSNYSCPPHTSCVCNMCEGDFESTRLSTVSINNHKLEIDANGFFGYPAFGTRTDFERIISVSKQADDYIEVCVTTQWGEETEKYKVKACDKLYNWFEI